ncbi:hypothetical protein MPTK1_5g24580 [Marchantia polymorpha subsp. ruderalis]
MMVLQLKIGRATKYKEMEWQNESMYCRLFESSKKRYTDVQGMQQKPARKTKVSPNARDRFCHSLAHRELGRQNGDRYKLRTEEVEYYKSSVDMCMSEMYYHKTNCTTWKKNFMSS